MNVREICICISSACMRNYVRLDVNLGFYPFCYRKEEARESKNSKFSPTCRRQEERLSMKNAFVHKNRRFNKKNEL